jgi:DNA polymerase elongation subunit (family B)
MTAKKPKIIYWDIETLPMICSTFTLYPERLSPKSILQEGAIICASFKTKGTKQVIKFSLLDDPKRFKKDPFDDFYVCKSIHDYLLKEDPDLLVAHNGDNFDYKWLNTRMIRHELGPLPDFAMDDTLKMARNKFKFHSNKLEHLVGFLGIEHKFATTYDMWLDIIKGKQKAVKDMVKYNVQDTKILEKVHERLLPYCKSKFNVGHLVPDGCTHCGNKSFCGHRKTRTGLTVYEYVQCTACGRWQRVRNIKNKKGPKYA